jgi:hypothetical protein
VNPRFNSVLEFKKDGEFEIKDAKLDHDNLVFLYLNMELQYKVYDHVLDALE